MKPNKNCKEFEQAITVEKMRNSDKYTIDHFVSSRELMYRAAKGIFDSVQWNNKNIAIITGSGNNGGDGYALAGILAVNDIYPTIIRVSEKFSNDGKYYYEQAKHLGVKDLIFNKDISFEDYDIIVDCILGTGFRGVPEGVVAIAINKINDSNAYVICADINSGINGDTGTAELAVKSDLTISIGYYKKGMFLGDAPALIKNLINVDIGIVLK